MGLGRVLFLIPFINSNKPIPKQKLFVQYSLLTNLSFSSFTHVLFELKAFKVLTPAKSGFFSLDKIQFREYLARDPALSNRIGYFKKIKPDWWKKWGKIVEEQLS